MKTKPLLNLAALLLICYFAAYLGAQVTIPNIPIWYEPLIKPSWTPPNWLFGPVWTLLYTMMAFAAWLITQKSKESKTKPALISFGIQLALNAIWSPLFFGWHQLGLSLSVIVLLWVAILVTLIKFWRIQILAGGLFIPYLIWVSYALSLNAAIWILNKP